MQSFKLARNTSKSVQKDRPILLSLARTNSIAHHQSLTIMNRAMMDSEVRRRTTSLKKKESLVRVGRHLKRRNQLHLHQRSLLQPRKHLNQTLFQRLSSQKRSLLQNRPNQKQSLLQRLQNQRQSQLPSIPRLRPSRQQVESRPRLKRIQSSC